MVKRFACKAIFKRKLRTTVDIDDVRCEDGGYKVAVEIKGFDLTTLNTFPNGYFI